jgi:hypothetical protein
MSHINFPKLTPTQFENLAYDLLTWRGLKNAVWRTPGADGGRDIEGEFEVQDLSGTYQKQKWYTDCKLYTKSVDWPTVYQKLSYADNHNADFLLIVCTPSVSPNCRTEIDTWNRKSKKIQIRVWEPHFLEQLLIEHPEIAIKHGFKKATLLEAPGFVDLAIEASKCADAAYSRHFFNSDSDSPELELASALANFLSEKMQAPGINQLNPSTQAFKQFEDSYEWLQCSTAVASKSHTLSSHAVRAILCVLRLATGGGQRITLKISNCDFLITLENDQPIVLSNGSLKLMRTIGLFGSAEIDIKENQLVVRAQS